MRAPHPIPAPNSIAIINTWALTSKSRCGKWETSKQASVHGESKYAIVEKHPQVFSHCQRLVNFMGRNTPPWSTPPSRTAQNPSPIVDSTLYPALGESIQPRAKGQRPQFMTRLSEHHQVISLHVPKSRATSDPTGHCDIKSGSHHPQWQWLPTGRVSYPLLP